MHCSGYKKYSLHMYLSLCVLQEVRHIKVYAFAHIMDGGNVNFVTFYQCSVRQFYFPVLFVSLFSDFVIFIFSFNALRSVFCFHSNFFICCKAMNICLYMHTYIQKNDSSLPGCAMRFHMQVHVKSVFI